MLDKYTFESLIRGQDGWVEENGGEEKGRKVTSDGA
jgi:hypothetical protein